HLTIRPLSGALGSFLDILGMAFGKPPAAVTWVAGTIVVWLHDSNTETNTRAPEASVASDLGCLPRMSITCGLASGEAGSNTLTWERPATHTKALSCWAPAKTMSVGSSPTSIVR